MRQFIPFEDDWDALANLRLEDLVPYRPGILGDGCKKIQRTAPTAPSTFNSSPICTPTRLAVPAESSST